MSTAITLRQLEIFLAVARAGHVTRASEILHLSQSAASMGIAQLERQLDIALFERDGRRLQLTERGRVLMTEAQALLDRVQALPALLSGNGAALRGELRIAASQTVGRYLLPPVLSRFAQAQPAASVDCRIRNTAAAIEALAAHEADVAYVEGWVRQPQLLAQPWRKDELVVVSTSADPSPRRLSPALLARSRWILREPGSGTRELFDQAVRSAGLPTVTPFQTLDDTEAVKQAVIAGAGLACLPRLAVTAELSAGRLRTLPASFLKLNRQLWRVTRTGADDGPLLRAFEAVLNADE